MEDETQQLFPKFTPLNKTFCHVNLCRDRKIFIRDFFSQRMLSTVGLTQGWYSLVEGYSLQGNKLNSLSGGAITITPFPFCVSKLYEVRMGISGLGK